MYRVRVAVPAAFALLAAALLSSLPATAQSYDQLRKWCLDGGTAEEALRGCEAVVDSPDADRNEKAAAWHNRGAAFALLHQFDLAIEDYGKATALKPDFMQAFLGRGIAWLSKADYEMAIHDLDEAIRLEPRQSSAYNARCWARAMLGQLQGALGDCSWALHLHTGDRHALDSRGLVYLKLGQWQAALTDYDTALAADPKMATALYGRGLARRKLGRAGSAADIAAARAIKPGVAREFASYGLKAE